MDSNDLPLNVSREILQDNKITQAMRKGCTKRALTMLERLGKNDAEKYQTFWNEFGQVLKEGPAEDMANKEQIAKLLRFSTTHTDSETQNVSLPEYIERMAEGQEKIYFVVADSFEAAKNSPHLEVFRKKGIEVLLMTDRVDEWLMSHLTEFDGKPLVSVAKGELDLGSLEDKEEQEKIKQAEESYKDLLQRMQETLGDKVKEVRVSHRLTDSPSCMVVEQHDMAVSMQKILKQAGHQLPDIQPILEVNPEHLLVKRLNDETDAKRFEDWTRILFDQALLSEGGQLDDPAAFVSRMNELLLLLTK